jgi:phosphoglycerate dehydrogenase-like enzyme
VQVCVIHEQAAELMGPLPSGVELLVANPEASADVDVSEADFWVPQFLSRGPAPDLLARMPALKVIQLITAGADTWVGRVPSHITLCDGRGIHSVATSEWTVTAILAYLKEFPHFARAQARGEWSRRVSDEVYGRRVLIVGAGDIGEAIATRLAPFGVRLTRVARTARAGVHGVDELPQLLPNADIVIIMVPLTPQTKRMVDKQFLAAMPDGALLVNSSRGPVVDSDALTAELASARLAAALDVTDPEPLPPGHPWWQMPNVLLTPHVGGMVRTVLPRAYALVGDQVRRYMAGEPLDNVVTDGY